MKKLFTLVTFALIAALGANAQTWKAGAEAPEAGAKLIDNDLVTVSTVSPTTANQVKNGDEPASVTIGDYSFGYNIQVRTDSPDPSADNPTGGVIEGSTALVVTAKKDVDVTFYFRRQKGSAGFDKDDNKDLLCWSQNSAKFQSEEEIIPIPDDEAYAYAKKTYKFAEGGVYTIYRRGSTMSVYGIDALAGTEKGEDGAAAEEYTVTADCTGEVQLKNLTITFLNNTSKGSTADAGTWAFSEGKAQADQNSCEIKFEPTAAGKLTIYFQAKLADNKPIVMFVDGDTGNTIPGYRAKDDSVIESGANHEELAAGEGVYYMLEAGKTYNFYASGTKYAVKGFSYESDATSIQEAVKVVSNGAVYNLAGQKVDENYKGVVIKNGKKMLQK